MCVGVDVQVWLACAHVCAFMWRSEFNIRYFPLFPSIFFEERSWGQGLSVKLEIAGWFSYTVWLGSPRNPVFACPAGITDACHASTPGFYMSTGDWPKVLMVAWQAFHQWSHLLSPAFRVSNFINVYGDFLCMQGTGNKKRNYGSCHSIIDSERKTHGSKW